MAVQPALLLLLVGLVKVGQCAQPVRESRLFFFGDSSFRRGSGYYYVGEGKLVQSIPEALATGLDVSFFPDLHPRCEAGASFAAEPLPLLKQIDLFLLLFPRDSPVFSGSLFLITTAVDDVKAAAATGRVDYAFEESMESYIEAIGKLYLAGARDIVVVGAADLDLDLVDMGSLAYHYNLTLTSLLEYISRWYPQLTLHFHEGLSNLCQSFGVIKL